MVKVRDESKSYDFTYKYHKDNSTITYEVNGSPYVWEVDELTNDTFRFHSNNDATDYLFGYSSSSGVKIVFDGKATEEN